MEMEIQLLLQEAEHKIDDIIKQLNDLSNEIWHRRLGLKNGSNIGQET